MKQLLHSLIKHPLITGSGVVFFGSLAGSFFHFLFNLFMSQNLSVADYGILASINSLVVIPAIITTSITPAIVHFAGGYFAKDQLSYAKDFFIKITSGIAVLGGVVISLFFIFSHSIASFFHIQDDASLIFLAGMLIALGFAGTVNMAFLQAKLAFRSISFFNFFFGFLKFLFGALLVTLGYHVFGAVVALFISGVLSYSLSLVPLRKLLRAKRNKADFNLKEIVLYTIPSALSIFAITSLISTDILLVKHFFPPVTAGLYAGLSLIGKVIFFFSSPIGTVMFPLIVQKHSKQENYDSILMLALLLVLLPSVAFSVFFYVFPDFVINFFLKNKDYLVVAPYIGLFSLFITLYSLLSVLTNFFLSIKKTAIYFPLMLGAVLQVALIWLYHSDFLQIITISISITGVLLVWFIFYYIKITYKNEKRKASEI